LVLSYLLFQSKESKLNRFHF